MKIAHAVGWGLLAFVGGLATFAFIGTYFKVKVGERTLKGIFDACFLFALAVFLLNL